MKYFTVCGHFKNQHLFWERRLLSLCLSLLSLLWILVFFFLMSVYIKLYLYILLHGCLAWHPNMCIQNNLLKNAGNCFTSKMLWILEKPNLNNYVQSIKPAINFMCFFVLFCLSCWMQCETTSRKSILKCVM